MLIIAGIVMNLHVQRNGSFSISTEKRLNIRLKEKNTTRWFNIEKEVDIFTSCDVHLILAEPH